MKKIGRPKGNNNKNYVCTIRMDEHTIKRLEAYCRLIKKAKSEVIRDAINMIVDRAECNDDN
ncbi:MAG: ribbon-helix-helix domain-containing protein [Butyrivibrio sp.]|nr:ribbon-helix-helix domain-containing protein [Acetatifactor muris]MCM1560141.1 ribbon-helix-helix domain-containing protein [Butyrivibrio sp.]